MPIEPKAPNSAICGSSKTLRPIAKAAGTTIAARTAFFSAYRPGSEIASFTRANILPLAMAVPGFDPERRRGTGGGHPQSNGGRTAWARNLATPVRDFLGTETGSALVLVGAVIAALLWANVDFGSYSELWDTHLSIQVGSHGIDNDLREWVNEGLMTLFFLVVGLEAKREIDLGELREHNRLWYPALAALGGIAGAVGIYLIFNAGGPGGGGWGVAMSTDTALALGVLALVAPTGSTRLRVFLLTLAIFDDLAALADHHHRLHRLDRRWWRSPSRSASSRSWDCCASCRRCAGRSPSWSGLGVWVALYESGIDPVIAGLAIGLVTSAYPPSRQELERATDLTREFREQPTAGRGDHRAAQPRRDDLGERADPVRAPPVDELRDRAALRARQRGHPHHRRPALRRGQLADHDRHRRRLRGRQAARHLPRRRGWRRGRRCGRSSAAAS